MRLTPHFTLEELSISNYAVRNGIDNTPDEAVIHNLQRLAEQLEQVRAILDHLPIHINSGYRCPGLNRAIGGAPTSAHLTGRAADIICPAFGTPIDICKRIIAAGVPFDQLIHEGRWVHFAVGISIASQDWREQVLTAIFTPGQPTQYRARLIG